MLRDMCDKLSVPPATLIELLPRRVPAVAQSRPRPGPQTPRDL